MIFAFMLYSDQQSLDTFIVVMAEEEIVHLIELIKWKGSKDGALFSVAA